MVVSLAWLRVALTKLAVFLDDGRQVVVEPLFIDRAALDEDAAIARHRNLAVSHQKAQLLAVGTAFVERFAAPVVANLLGHSHEDRVFDGAVQALGQPLLVALLLEKEQAGEDVDVGLDDEAFDGQFNARQHPGMFRDPGANVFIAGIAQNAVRQHDAQSPARLEPLQAALDKEDVGWQRALHAAPPRLVDYAETALVVALPGVRARS